jgi:hypothetical protein
MIAGNSGVRLVDENAGAVRTAADGSFRLERLEAGLYTVEVQADGFAPERRPGVAVAVGEVAGPVEVALEAGGNLEVAVDAPGVEGGFVTVEAEGGWPSLPHRPWSPGKPVVFASLRPGSYRVRAQDLLDRLRGTAEIVVSAGAPLKLTVKLEPR